MSFKKLSAAIVLITALLTGMCVSASAAVTEIRRNFFEQTANLPATAIMSGPSGEDGSYLIAIYESATTPAPPTLRWTDENGVPRTKSAVRCSSSCQLLAFVRVKAGTEPTVETSGYTGPSAYSLYVSGLGFWPEGTQGQGGLSKATGVALTDKLVYTAAASVSGLFVAYSNSFEGQQAVTWWDENGERTAPITYGATTVIPIRIAAGTGVRIHDTQNTHVWYGLILFGLPSSGSGPFTDYEYNMLEWTNASYPHWRTVFSNGNNLANILIATNLAEQPNTGIVQEALALTGVGGVDPAPCPNGFLADPAGDPLSCVLPFTVRANTDVQVLTVNQPGIPWGLSPTYSAEVAVLLF